MIDGRAELVAEVEGNPEELRTYIASELARHRGHARFPDGILGGLLPNQTSQDRAELVVLPRIASLISGERSRPVDSGNGSA